MNNKLRSKIRVIIGNTQFNDKQIVITAIINAYLYSIGNI